MTQGPRSAVLPFPAASCPLATLRQLSRSERAVFLRAARACNAFTGGRPASLAVRVAFYELELARAVWS